MKPALRVLAVALAGALLSRPCVAAGDPAPARRPTTMLSIVESQNGQTFEVHAGDLVQVTLAENASTGWRWAVDRYDAGRVELLPAEPHYQAGAVGSGGEVTFRFRAKQAGSARIELKQWRHWEGDSSVTARFQLELRVLP